ncbi:structural maintenance of chromosomes protein 1A [Striga asiatica]|uniref:Structural maintenance of chromosomes protein 1A n=1 Tax=Striga asiatica TaxID=4170 RepID=A0A5A7PKR7_STRAF|nr:structural maintenance of chromosomes protein 1A [Striga asiatica]
MKIRGGISVIMMNCMDNYSWAKGTCEISLIGRRLELLVKKFDTNFVHCVRRKPDNEDSVSDKPLIAWKSPRRRTSLPLVQQNDVSDKGDHALEVVPRKRDVAAAEQDTGHAKRSKVAVCKTSKSDSDFVDESPRPHGVGLPNEPTTCEEDVQQPEMLCRQVYMQQIDDSSARVDDVHGSPRPKRHIRVTSAFKSPYKQREIDVDKKLNVQERMISNWIMKNDMIDGYEHYSTLYHFFKPKPKGKRGSSYNYKMFAETLESEIKRRSPHNLKNIAVRREIGSNSDV